MSFYPYTFTGFIEHHNLGTYRYTVIFLPKDLHADLPLDKYPRLRVSGEIAEQPFEGAWQPVRGRWYIMLSKKLLKDAAVGVGDDVEVRFEVVDQEAVDIPLELQQALSENSQAADAWEALTVGKRRGLTHRISSAKTAKTRTRRLQEVLEILLETS
ncbi:MAG: YdeI/OmpD-associated family protein [Deinococcota bacterium]